MSCNLPAHQGIDSRVAALENVVARLSHEVARLSPLERTVDELKLELHPLKLSHLRLRARSLLSAELVFIATETGVSAAELSEKFTGFSGAMEWINTHPRHSTITRDAIAAAESKANAIATGAVRCRVRLAAGLDAHPYVLECRNEQELMDIIGAFPVNVAQQHGRDVVVSVDDICRVVLMFLTATGQLLLARKIKQWHEDHVRETHAVIARADPAEWYALPLQASAKVAGPGVEGARSATRETGNR